MTGSRHDLVVATVDQFGEWKRHLTLTEARSLQADGMFLFPIANSQRGDELCYIICRWNGVGA